MSYLKVTIFAIWCFINTSLILFLCMMILKQKLLDIVMAHLGTTFFRNLHIYMPVLFIFFIREILHFQNIFGSSWTNVIRRGTMKISIIQTKRENQKMVKGVPVVFCQLVERKLICFSSLELIYFLTGTYVQWCWGPYNKWCLVKLCSQSRERSKSYLNAWSSSIFFPLFFFGLNCSFIRGIL